MPNFKWYPMPKSFNDGIEAYYSTNPVDFMWYPMPNLCILQFAPVIIYEGVSFSFDFTIINNGIWKAEGIVIIITCPSLNITLYNNTNSPFDLDDDRTIRINVGCSPISNIGTFILNITIDPNNIVNEAYSSKDGTFRQNCESDNSKIVDFTILSASSGSTILVEEANGSGDEEKDDSLLNDETIIIGFAILTISAAGFCLSN